MIRCSHCGKLAPTGAVSCQHCGMPLVSSGGEVTSAGQAGQPELPAWLESLRAHERPVPGGQESRQPFSMDELVDENSMPSWMRQDRQRVPEGGNSDAFPALAEPAQPGAGPETQNFAPSGLEAGSLIDERSLPAWMRDNQGSGQPGASQNFSAGDLVDQRALPAWIKELGQAAQPQMPTQPAANNYGLPAQQPAMNQYGLPVQAPAAPSPLSNTSPRVPQTPPGVYNTPAATPTQGFSAHDLIDQQAMPAWMTGGQEPGAQPQNRPVPTEHGFSAGDLVDQRSVPTWMKDLQGPAKSDPISAMGVPVNGSGQVLGQGQQGVPGGEGMPASALLDMNSMPSWMREGTPGSAGNAQATALPGEGMAAGSLIDMGSLPAWLRNGDNPQQTPQSGDAGPSSAHPVPARPEMRVPSRPRNEIVGQEQSEVAANVFASMLGVSASAPALPDQMAANNNLGVAQGQPVFPGQQTQQPVIPGWQSPSQPPTLNQGAQPQMWQTSGPLPAYGSSPAPNTYAPVSQPGGKPPAQPPYTGLPTADSAAFGSAAGNQGQREPQAVGAKKKGFFDSIRDFFSK